MTTDRSTLVKFAWLSVSAAVVTMVIKFVAYSLTDSIGLLSDALESSVNLVAAIGAVVALSLAARPADEDHEYGHAKAEYFSSLAEGLMIMLAAATIAWAAIDRLLHPQELEKLGIGIAIAVVASLINLGVALVLLRVGRRERSIALEGDSKHLMTDVWTTAGVVVAVALVGITGIEWLDPVIGLAVAANIIIAGLRLVARSSRGLMDSAIPPDERSLLDEVLESYTSAQTQFHGVRTRQAGYRSFMSVHVLVPGSWSVQRSHDLVERIEADLRDQVPFLSVDTHVEPLEDPRSFADEELDRRGVPPSARPMGPEADKLR